jgi:hypothetical protein
VFGLFAASCASTGRAAAIRRIAVRARTSIVSLSIGQVEQFAPAGRADLAVYHLAACAAG